MSTLRRTTTMLGATLAASALVLGTTTLPANAADREFSYAGADVEYEVEKDDGRFEVEVEIDDAKPGSRWQVVLRHDGKRYYKKTHRANGDGEIEIEKNRPNTRGKDVFKMKVKKIGVKNARVRTIRLR